MTMIDRVDREGLRHLIDSALELGIELAPLLLQLGLGVSIKELRGPLRISFNDYLSLQRALNRVVRETVHERVGRRALTPEQSEVLFYYLLGAEDLGGAIERIKFFTQLVGERIGEGAIRLSIVPPQLAKLYVRIGMDAAMQQAYAKFFLWEHVKIFEVLAWLIGQRVPLVKVDLPFAANPDIDRFVVQLRCPVSYNASGYGFYFPKAMLHKPVSRSVAELKSFLKMYGAVFVREEHFERPPLSQRIERILETQALDHGSMPSASELANALNMSEATMRRHLQDGGKSFSEIKSACRLRLGKKLLAIPNRDVEEIAQQLGYQDVNAFRRAFRQLSGQTPEGFRKNAGGLSAR